MNDDDDLVRCSPVGVAAADGHVEDAPEHVCLGVATMKADMGVVGRDRPPELGMAKAGSCYATFAPIADSV